jgi:lipid A disaccharide synthetase
VHKSSHSNGHGADNSEPIVARLLFPGERVGDILRLLTTFIYASQHFYIEQNDIHAQACHLWAQDNSHAICECGYQVCININIWDETVWDTVMGSYLLPDRLNAQ